MSLEQNMQILFEYCNQYKDIENLSHLRWQLGHESAPDQLSNRKNMTGHLTASGLAIDLSKSEQPMAMLIRHPYLNIWTPPGGHSEGIEIPLQETAITEIFEETGYIVKPFSKYPHILDIDTHFIPGNPVKDEWAHYHHDSIFLFEITGLDASNREFTDEQITWIDLKNPANDYIRLFPKNNRIFKKCMDKISRLGLF